jgi:nucleoside-diphosphate-sugar epimerase
MEVLVTGATGFVGSHLVDYLAAQGARVRAMVRHSSDTHHLTRPGVQLVPGDLADQETLIAAVKGVDIVFHAAALLSTGHTASAILEINLTGTENLLKACTVQSVGRFVFFSSGSVYGLSPATLIDEQTPQVPTDAYGRSKALAEASVRHHGEVHGLKYSILRPCRIYGERDERFTARLLRLLRGPIIAVAPDGRPHYNLVHASDVAAAALLAGQHSRAVGEAFNITDGRGASLRQMSEILQNLKDRKQLVVQVPQGVLRFARVARALSRAQRPTGRGLGPWFHTQRYDISKAQRLLGYEPQVKLPQGLRRALAWYEQARC